MDQEEHTSIREMVKRRFSATVNPLFSQISKIPKRTFIPLFLIVFLMISVAVTTYLSQQKQEIRGRAATSTSYSININTNYGGMIDQVVIDGENIIDSGAGAAGQFAAFDGDIEGQQVSDCGLDGQGAIFNPTISTNNCNSDGVDNPIDSGGTNDLTVIPQLWNFKEDADFRYHQKAELVQGNAWKISYDFTHDATVDHPLGDGSGTTTREHPGIEGAFLFYLLEPYYKFTYVDRSTGSVTTLNDDGGGGEIGRNAKEPWACLGDAGSKNLCLVVDNRNCWFSYDKNEKGNPLHIIKASSSVIRGFTDQSGQKKSAGFYLVLGSPGDARSFASNHGLSCSGGGGNPTSTPKPAPQGPPIKVYIKVGNENGRNFTEHKKKDIRMASTSNCSACNTNCGDYVCQHRQQEYKKWPGVGEFYGKWDTSEKNTTYRFTIPNFIATYPDWRVQPCDISTGTGTAVVSCTIIVNPKGSTGTPTPTATPKPTVTPGGATRTPTPRPTATPRPRPTATPKPSFPCCDVKSGRGYAWTFTNCSSGCSTCTDQTSCTENGGCSWDGTSCTGTAWSGVTCKKIQDDYGQSGCADTYTEYPSGSGYPVEQGNATCYWNTQCH